MKKIVSLLLVAAVIFSMFSFNLNTSAASGIQSKLDTIKAVYPTGSYFTIASSSSPCSSSNHDVINGVWCSGCYLPSIPARGGLPSGSAVGFTADTCCGFATYVYYCIFGHSHYNDAASTSRSPVFGDLVYTGTHWFIYLSEDSNNYYVYDANGYGGSKNKVIYNNYFPKSAVKSLTVYHANNYDAVNGPHVHNYTEYAYFLKSHPHYKCYKCSCGDIKENVNEKVFYNLCDTCLLVVTPTLPEVSGLKSTYLLNEPLEISWKPTENTTHYDIFLESKKNGEYSYYENIFEYKNTEYSKTLPVGEYRIAVVSYNSSFWKTDNSDWLNSGLNYLEFNVVETECEHNNTEIRGKVAATCSKEGYTGDTYCLDCGEKISSGKAIDKLKHNYKDEVIPPTFGKQGYTLHTCTLCGDTYKDNYTSYEPSETDPLIEVSSVRGIIGNQVKVAVSLKNNPGIASMSLKLDYDANILKLVNVEDCGVLGSQVHNPSLGTPYYLNWANDTATTNFTANGNIAVLTFEILDGAPLGKTSIKVSYDYDNYGIYNVNTEKVFFAVSDGAVDVTDVLLGDVNGDGIVNNYDRLLLTRWLAKWPEALEKGIIEAAADVNCDGKVNNLDRLILTRHLAHWAEYSTLPYAG